MAPQSRALAALVEYLSPVSSGHSQVFVAVVPGKLRASILTHNSSAYCGQTTNVFIQTSRKVWPLPFQAHSPHLRTFTLLHSNLSVWKLLSPHENLEVFQIQELG